MSLLCYLFGVLFPLADWLLPRISGGRSQAGAASPAGPPSPNLAPPPLAASSEFEQLEWAPRFGQGSPDTSVNLQHTPIKKKVYIGIDVSSPGGGLADRSTGPSPTTRAPPPCQGVPKAPWRSTSPVGLERRWRSPLPARAWRCAWPAPRECASSPAPRGSPPRPTPWTPR